MPTTVRKECLCARDRCASSVGTEHPLFAQILAAEAALHDDRGDFDAADRLYNSTVLDLSFADVQGGQLVALFVVVEAGEFIAP